MTIWVHMKAVPMSANLRAVLRSKHQERRPRNGLSITLNAAGTEAIVKIAGADRSFIDSLGLDKADVIRIYTEADHRQIFDDVGFYTTAWQIEEDEKPVEVRAEARVDAAREIGVAALMAEAEPKPSLWRRMLNAIGLGKVA